MGADYHPILDDRDPVDLAVRDAFLNHLGGVQFTGVPPVRLAATLARVVGRHPSLLTHFGRWLARRVIRIGPLRMLRGGIRPVTFVMHSFMDAADVAPAWAATQRGETCTEPRLRETQERLAACSYAMAHPDTGELVPACVQHSVLDPVENVALRALLPLTPVTRSGGP